MGLLRLPRKTTKGNITVRTIPEFLKQVEDFFEPWELVEYLQLSMDDVMDAFEDQVIEAEEDLCEYMNVKSNNEEDDDG